MIGNDIPVGNYETGKRLVEVKGKTDVGDMSEDGLFTKNDGGTTRVIFKEISDQTAKNCVNAVWLNESTWESNIHYYHDVGQIEASGDMEGGFVGDWNSSEMDFLPEMLELSPVFDKFGNVYAYTTKVANDVP